MPRRSSTSEAAAGRPSVAGFAALLRGINVGGHRRVPMADLRDVLGGLGFDDVKTYLQSGNATFSATGVASDELEGSIGAALADRFGFDVDVLVRAADEFAAVMAANPFSEEAASDPTRVHAVFLATPLAEGRLEAIGVDCFAPDRVEQGDRVVYLHVPDGLGRSKLAAALSDARLGVATTARNWRTVEAIGGLLADLRSRGGGE